jgi:hypothetical protein
LIITKNNQAIIVAGAMLPLSLKANSQGNYFLRAPHNVRPPNATQHIFALELPSLGTHTYRLQIVKERLADPHFFASLLLCFDQEVRIIQPRTRWSSVFAKNLGINNKGILNNIL